MWILGIFHVTSGYFNEENNSTRPESLEKLYLLTYAPLNLFFNIKLFLQKIIKLLCIFFQTIKRHDVTYSVLILQNDCIMSCIMIMYSKRSTSIWAHICEFAVVHLQIAHEPSGLERVINSSQLPRRAFFIYCW